ncbi:16S rRNA (guanine(527)-N(7))-methyltransferase RsmG [Litorimonas haliclonae]|uniref:16S rRNA (guanine(527)-N(7))-methyltransferase RsmG n=1 Tax=Litorimonas haliclonae TaxID=2081977 RepID=UPI0039EF1F19
MQPEEEFQAKTNVSHETLKKYKAWHRLLVKWNAKINLVAKSTLPEFWTRHALDSWQITPLLRETDQNCLDFGSGGGFPGLSVAIALAERAEARVTLTESAGKKASFLKTVSREVDLPTHIHSGRIEDLDDFSADVITARAFAPLDRLLGYSQPFLSPETQLLLLKGAAVDEELELARAQWTFDYETVKSLSDEDGCILKVKNVNRR